MKNNLSVFLFLIAITFCFTIHAQVPAAYNIVWNSPSQHAGESMPCGGGDIGMNVWVENGDVLVYIARSGQFDENNGLMKSGRLRIQLLPNLLNGGSFKQELHLQEGYVSIQAEKAGIKTEFRIYAEVLHPVVRIEINTSKPTTAVVKYENWRYQDRVIKSRENFGNSYKWAAPKNNIIRKDSTRFAGNHIISYHHNQAETIFDVIVKQQGMDSVKPQLYNPLKQLAFGLMLSGINMVPDGESTVTYTDTDYKAWALKSSRPTKTHTIQANLSSDQTNDISAWINNLTEQHRQATLRYPKSFATTKSWWKQFCERSFIQINTHQPLKDTIAWQVGRNYQLFRYMLACNAYGKWPTKFNGGLLTVDPVYTDSAMHLTPDYRNWGGGLHTMQNQRLVYFPMLRSGDYDMMQSQLDFYMRIQRNAELRSKVYWNHDGACFTEQMENFGLPNYAEYGTNRPPDHDKGLEYNAWLEYQWDTVFEFCLMMLEKGNYNGESIAAYIPFIESCLRFFDEHYQYLASKRGSKKLDENGKLILFPGSAAETYKMAYNAGSTIAALQTITQRMLALPTHILGENRKQYLSGFLQRIPALPYHSLKGKTALAPATAWERVQNTESPQLYPVYPWGIYGIGRPGLDIALNTWHNDTLIQKFRSHLGWKQDNIWAARLGLNDEAWKYTSLKLQNSGRRFPAFWGPGFDWVPDHNWGGSGMIGLQEMLLQTHEDELRILPSWPKQLDVHFKLHAPKQTVVEVVYSNGVVQTLKVMPESRRKDVILPGWLQH